MTTEIENSTQASSVPGLSGPARDAFVLLRIVFTIAPIVAGLDKFTNLLTDWDRYLAPQINDLVPGSAHQAMLIVGVVEIAAGVLVAGLPRIGGYVVALWLAGIIANLLLLGDYYDVALRDFGLLLAAVALARLAALAPRRSPRTRPVVVTSPAEPDRVDGPSRLAGPDRLG